jgi:hypothetical protein
MWRRNAPPRGSSPRAKGFSALRLLAVRQPLQAQRDRVLVKHIALSGVIAEQRHSFGADCSGQHRIQGCQRQRVSHGQFKIGSIVHSKPVAARQGQNTARPACRRS